MTQRAGTPVHIHFCVVQTHFMHEGQRHDGECLVYFPKVDVVFCPADTGQEFLCGRDRCRGEQAGCLRMTGVAHDLCTDVEPLGFGSCFRGQNQRRSTIRD